MNRKNDFQRHKLKTWSLVSVACIFSLFNLFYFFRSDVKNSAQEECDNTTLAVVKNDDVLVLEWLDYFQNVFEEKTAPSLDKIANYSELMYQYGIKQNEKKELFVCFAQAVRIKYKLPELKLSTPFEEGMAHYIVDCNGFLPLIKEMQIIFWGEKYDEQDDNNIIWHHLASDFVCDERANKLLGYIKKGLPGVTFKGKSIVDIGGGTAVLSAMEAEETGDSDGKIICIEVVPVFKQFADYMKKYDERYKKIDYRIASMSSAELKKGEADIITLMDMHMLRFNSRQDFKDGFIDIKQWLDSVSLGLKDDGYLFIYDRYDFEGQEKMTEELLENCGFYVEKKHCIQNNQERLLFMTLRKRHN